MDEIMRNQIMEIIDNAAAAIRMAKEKQQALPLPQRAIARANDAMVAYDPYAMSIDESGERAGDLQDVLTDLLTDLRHMAGRERIDFNRSIELSADHFEAETGEEQ